MGTGGFSVPLKPGEFRAGGRSEKGPAALLGPRELWGSRSSSCAKGARALKGEEDNKVPKHKSYLLCDSEKRRPETSAFLSRAGYRICGTQCEKKMPASWSKNRTKVLLKVHVKPEQKDN